MPCECGNKNPCGGKYGFLVLYDIVGNGVPVLNYKRAERCTKLKEKRKKVFEQVKNIRENS